MNKFIGVVWMGLGLAVLGGPQVLAAQPGEAVTAVSPDVKLAYKVLGPSTGRPVILIAGTGMQLVEWPETLVDGLVAQGRRVIVFDNRDVGHSTSYPEAGMPDFAATFAAKANGAKIPLPYTGHDLAGDVTVLMDRLRIERADIIGVSGGATLAELVAADAPDRVRALVLVMANSGNPAHPIPADAKRMATSQVPGADATAGRMALGKALAGKDDNFDAAEADAVARAAIARNPDPLGGVRQGAALLALGDIRQDLVRIKAPAYVIHGVDDPLISLAAGEEVARSIPGAKWQVVQGMGHNLTSGGIDVILRAITEVAPVSK